MLVVVVVVVACDLSSSSSVSTEPRVMDDAKLESKLESSKETALFFFSVASELPLLKLHLNNKKYSWLVQEVSFSLRHIVHLPIFLALFFDSPRSKFLTVLRKLL